MPAKIECTEELALEICRLVSTTPDMLEEICDKNPHIPKANLIYEWRIKYPFFGEMFTRAKQCQIEVLVSRIFMLARSNKGEYIDDDKGVPRPDGVIMNNKRLEIDSIKWLAAKLAPKIYGEAKSDKGNEADAISQFRVENE